MEEELGAPMFRAVVISKKMNDGVIELQVRYHRKNFFNRKRKKFLVSVQRGEANSQYHLQKYLSAKQLEPGDELYVDPYGEEWCDPLYHNSLQRKWNLKFA